MPIKPIVLQRRHAELGRIRLGYKADTQNGGTRPAKLETFRFTSVSERYIRDLAQLYGGEPRQWDNGGIASWEVYTEAKSVPVIAVKGGLSQWMEYWSGGGCIHRCDGETNVLTGEPCDLEEKVQVGRKQVNPHAEARPTTRLSLMLPELDAIGVWRCETHGWNAAAEIPAVAELAQFVGDLVPAHLHLVERRAIKDGQTSRFVVPVLDLQIGTQRLRELVAERSGMAPPKQLEGSQPAALPSGQGGMGGDAYDEWFDQVSDAETLEQMSAIWSQCVAAKLVGVASAASPRRAEFITAWQERAHEIKAAGDAADGPAAGGQPHGEGAGASTPPVPSSSPDADGVYEGVVVEDADQIWERIVRAGGERGYTLPDLEDDFAQQMGGLTVDSADASELYAYLKIITSKPAA